MESSDRFAHQRGAIFLWIYRENARNYPGWNLSADREGCASAIEICRELARGKSASRSLKVSPPTSEILSVPNNRAGRAKWAAPSRLRIEMTANDAEASFGFDELSSALTLQLDAASLSILERTFQDILAGRGDYSVKVAGESIWLWWHP